MEHWLPNTNDGCVLEGDRKLVKGIGLHHFKRVPTVVAHRFVDEYHEGCKTVHLVSLRRDFDNQTCLVCLSCSSTFSGKLENNFAKI